MKVKDLVGVKRRVGVRRGVLRSCRTRACVLSSGTVWETVVKWCPDGGSRTKKESPGGSQEKKKEQ